MIESNQNKEEQIKNRKLPGIIGINETVQEAIEREDFEKRISKV